MNNFDRWKSDLTLKRFAAHIERWGCAPCPLHVKRRRACNRHSVGVSGNDSCKKCVMVWGKKEAQGE